MIISFVQTKGGTGKSTLAQCTVFSRALRKRFKSIALVELDAQGTLRNWWDERAEEGRKSEGVSFHHISSTQKEVFQEGIKTIAAHNKLIVMDIPGESTGRLHTRFACAFSDIAVVPMRTTTNDEAAFANNLYPIIRDIITMAPQKKHNFAVLPAFVHPKTSKAKLKAYYEEILPDHVFCLPAVYPARAVYENFNRNGMTVSEYASTVKSNKRQAKQAMAAVKDIEAIAEAIMEKAGKSNGNS